ncbi:hypothetical protein [Shewanella algae]|uniref:hypothetical protein n=1 Tax=Shewanella algae TaxID=38313 RepID=UPI00118722BA|nr:hypothetical protein [Shewanella algae]
MEISVLQPPVNGMIEATVNLYEVIDELGHEVSVNVWVPDSDSRSELANSAFLKALEILRKSCVELESQLSKS